jgi:hypothetical protein
LRNKDFSRWAGQGEAGFWSWLTPTAGKHQDYKRADNDHARAKTL